MSGSESFEIHFGFKLTHRTPGAVNDHGQKREAVVSPLVLLPPPAASSPVAAAGSVSIPGVASLFVTPAIHFIPPIVTILYSLV